MDSGREALEENAALCAKNTFVRHAVDGQIEALEAIRHGASVVDAEGSDDFQVAIQYTTSGLFRKLIRTIKDHSRVP